MPNKLVEPVMITSPDGEGVILSGGALWINGRRKFLNTFIELRMNSETKELAWTTLDQKMAVERERHVMFAIPDSYCGDEKNTNNNHSEMAFLTWATAGTILTLGIGITVTYVCLKRRLVDYWRKNTDNNLSYAMKNNISEEISNHEDLLTEPHLELGNSSGQHFPDIHQEINPSYQEYNTLPLLNKEKITTGNVIGNGSFGDVYEGTLYSTRVTYRKVAIKVLKNSSNCEEFYKEALAANGLQHENIVEFLGISNGPTSKMILFEFMDGGQLLDYLKCKGEQLSISDLIEILVDVCKGCAYMELMKFVHRDLAARNCLLTFSDKLKRKVHIINLKP